MEKFMFVLDLLILGPILCHFICGISNENNGMSVGVVLVV